MRVLIDEYVPKRLGAHLDGHEIMYVTTMGWSGKKNGELLQLMIDNNMNVLLTVDQNLYYQQNLSGLNISVIVLVAKSNKLVDLVPLVPELHIHLSSVQSGKLIEINQ